MHSTRTVSLTGISFIFALTLPHPLSGGHRVEGPPTPDPMVPRASPAVLRILAVARIPTQ